MMTGPEPGLTRDAIPISWEYKGQPIRLVDTAGLRRRARIEEKGAGAASQDILNGARHFIPRRPDDLARAKGETRMKLSVECGIP